MQLKSVQKCLHKNRVATRLQYREMYVVPTETFWILNSFVVDDADAAAAACLESPIFDEKSQMFWSLGTSFKVDWDRYEIVASLDDR